MAKRLSHAEEFLLSKIHEAGGGIASNDPRLTAVCRRTRYTATLRLVERGLITSRLSLRDTRIRIYSLVEATVP